MPVLAEHSWGNLAVQFKSVSVSFKVYCRVHMKSMFIITQNGGLTSCIPWTACCGRNGW